MATALDLITRGLRLIGVVAAGEDPSAEEAADGLLALNEMLESMSNEGQLVYQIVQETLTWAGGNASRTIGVGGNLNTARPIRLDESTFVRSNGYDYFLRILTDQDYAAVADKAATSDLPWAIYADRGFPLANLYLVGVPSGNVELHLASWKVLQSFAGLTTEVSLPPGYARMLRFNFALEQAGEYGVEPASEVRRIAMKSRAVLQPTNEKNERMELPRGMPGMSPYRGSILTGD